MTVEMVARTIQFVVAPVVMLTACAILQGGLLEHYGAINDRLRALNHERLELVLGAASIAASAGSLPAYRRERLLEIDRQAPELLRRHKRMHDCVLAIYWAIFFFGLDMATIGLAVGTGSTLVANLALVVFFAGLLALLASIYRMAGEIRTSQQAIDYEVQRVLTLSPSEPEPASTEDLGKVK
jgi:hypothetical protein